eukprot:1870301-Prymnesium_polylepis.1
MMCAPRVPARGRHLAGFRGGIRVAWGGSASQLWLGLGGLVQARCAGFGGGNEKRQEWAERAGRRHSGGGGGGE